MEKKDYPEIDAKVKKTLEQTEFAASDLERLSGGFVNWVYRAKLSKALEDGTTEVLVKHGELFMSARPEFELNLQRCVCLSRNGDTRLFPYAIPADLCSALKVTF